MPLQQRARGFVEEPKAEMSKSKDKPTLLSGSSSNPKARRNGNVEAGKANTVVPSEADAVVSAQEGQNGV